MIARIISACARAPFFTIMAVAAAVLWGVHSLSNTPLDAIPDLSDTQVIVSTEWTGRSPDLVEDQITYPIVSALLLGAAAFATCAARACSATRSSTSCSRTAPTSTGRAAVCSSI